MTTKDLKSLAKVIDMMAEGIEEKCGTIAALTPSRRQLERMPQELAAALTEAFGPAAAAIQDIDKFLRELRGVAKRLRTAQ